MLVLRLIKEQRGREISRADIAKLTKMSATSISRIVDDLVRAGMVKETSPITADGWEEKEHAWCFRTIKFCLWEFPLILIGWVCASLILQTRYWKKKRTDCKERHTSQSKFFSFSSKCMRSSLSAAVFHRKQ